MDLEEQDMVEIQVKSYAQGEIEVLPTSHKYKISVQALRLNLEYPWRDTGIGHVDITSGRLRKLLLPLLDSLPVGGRIFRFTRWGPDPDDVDAELTSS
jgi:hypothetical protein